MTVRIIIQHSGARLKSGVHTGYSVTQYNGVYYISTESGTRKATTRELKKLDLINKRR
jgi:hypothetical protein